MTPEAKLALYHHTVSQSIPLFEGKTRLERAKLVDDIRAGVLKKIADIEAKEVRLAA